MTPVSARGDRPVQLALTTMRPAGAPLTTGGPPSFVLEDIMTILLCVTCLGLATLSVRLWRQTSGGLA